MQGGDLRGMSTVLPYQIAYYEAAPSKRFRYVLGSAGERPLLVFGVNPSQADAQRPDATLRRVLGFAGRAGYDSFYMLNLYPQRATLPRNLHQRMYGPAHRANLAAIERVLQRHPQAHAWAAWGNLVAFRPYLQGRCLPELLCLCDRYALTWWQLGDLTQAGHPRHPLRAGYGLSFRPYGSPV
jgi:hypothetical protein